MLVARASRVMTMRRRLRLKAKKQNGKMKRGLTYRERTLWWRAQAKATNSLVLAVATITTTARRATANVPAAKITSVRFGMSLHNVPSPFAL